MSHRPSFEEIVDRCIDEIASGRSSVAACIEAWPEHRERLAPVLEAAVAVGRIPRIPERPVDPARRAQFVAQLRRTQQQTPPRTLLRRLIPSLPALSLPRLGLVAAPAAAIAALAIFVVLGSGTSTAYAATVTTFGEGVELADGDAWLPLSNGDPLDEGARVRTTTDAEAVLTFEDGSTVTLRPSTEVVLRRSHVDGSRDIAIEQASGSLWNSVAPDDSEGASFTVETPDAVVTAHGTLFETTITDGETSVSTSEGTVEVVAGEQRVFVRDGEFTRARQRRFLDAVQRAEDGSRPLLELSVDGPFAAALIAPSGLATGVTADGVRYLQIRGAFTSLDDDGIQRITLAGPQGGVYHLLLRRVDEGSGEVVASIGGHEHRVTVEGDAMVVHFQLQLTGAPDDVEITSGPNRGAAARLLRELDERVVITDRARERAEPIADRWRRFRDGLRDRAPELPGATSTPQRDLDSAPVIGTPRPQPTDSATPSRTMEPTASPTATATARPTTDATR